MIEEMYGLRFEPLYLIKIVLASFKREFRIFFPIVIAIVMMAIMLAQKIDKMQRFVFCFMFIKMKIQQG